MVVAVTVTVTVTVGVVTVGVVAVAVTRTRMAQTREVRDPVAGLKPNWAGVEYYYITNIVLLSIEIWHCLVNKSIEKRSRDSTRQCTDT